MIVTDYEVRDVMLVWQDGGVLGVEVYRSCPEASTNSDDAFNHHWVKLSQPTVALAIGVSLQFTYVSRFESSDQGKARVCEQAGGVLNQKGSVFIWKGALLN